MKKDLQSEEFDDEFEEQIDEIEEEQKEEDEIEESEESTRVSKKKESVKKHTIEETYEPFTIPQRTGILNTITKETMEGFKDDDLALVNVLNTILNKLDRISISCGV